MMIFFFSNEIYWAQGWENICMKSRIEWYKSKNNLCSDSESKIIYWTIINRYSLDY